MSPWKFALLSPNLDIVHQVSFVENVVVLGDVFQVDLGSSDEGPNEGHLIRAGPLQNLLGRV